MHPHFHILNKQKMKKVSIILLLSVFLVLTICFCSKSTNPGTKEPDFALQVSPQTEWVTAGDSAELKIKLISLNGFSAPCTLSLVGLPQEDTAGFLWIDYSHPLSRTP
jgi:hypothetical protein